MKNLLMIVALFVLGTTTVFSNTTVHHVAGMHPTKIQRAGWSGAFFEGHPGYNGNGLSATNSKLNSPVGGAIWDGEFYFADRDNNRIRKIQHSTNTLITVAGDGTPSTLQTLLDDEGRHAINAAIEKPRVIRFDDVGNMYIAEREFIRKVDVSGIITTILKNGQDCPYWANSPYTCWPHETHATLHQRTLGNIDDLLVLGDRLYIASEFGVFYIYTNLSENQPLNIVSYVHQNYNLEEKYKSHGKSLAKDHNGHLYAIIQPVTGVLRHMLVRIFENDEMQEIATSTTYDSNHPGEKKPLQYVAFGALKMSFDNQGALFMRDFKISHKYQTEVMHGPANTINPTIVGDPDNFANTGDFSTWPASFLLSTDTVTFSEDGHYYITDRVGHAIYRVDLNPYTGAMPATNLDTYDFPLDGNCGLDATTDGEVLGCNPVNPVTGVKLDYVIDYQNHSPYPIVWGRRYNSSNGEWKFEHQRSLNIYSLHQSNAMVMNRPDGTTLQFKKGPNALDPWIPDMGNNNSVVNVPQSLMAGNITTGYTYLNLNDEVERYNNEGRLISLTSKEGWVLTFLYDGQKRLNKITDSFGRYLNIIYSPTVSRQSHIISVSDGTKTIQYNQTRALTKLILLSVTYPDSRTISYSYDENRPFAQGLLTGIHQNGVRLAKYEYNADNRVTRTIHDPDNNPVNDIQYSYGSGATILTYGDKESIVLHDPTMTNGATKPYALTSRCEVCTGSQTHYKEYDVKGNPIAEENLLGHIDHKTYNDRSLVTEVIQSVGLPEQTSTNIQWHATSRQPETIVEHLTINGSASTRTTNIQYNSSAQPISISQTSSLGGTRVSNIVYHATLKLPISKTDHEGRTTNYEYDGQGNLLKVTNALGHETIFNDYTASGLARRITQPNGLQIKFDFDNADRIEGSMEADDPSQRLYCDHVFCANINI